jgi:hypothetical protein
MPVTVTLGVIGTKGPVYTCVLTAADTDIEEFLAHIPMRVTESGNQTVGKTVMVRLVAGVGGPYPDGTTGVRFSADLPVLGAQQGKVTLSEKVTDLASTVTRASGALRLTKAGTDRILVPEKFTVAFNAPVDGVQVPLAFTFTIKTSPTPAGLALKVAKGHLQPRPGSSPTPSASPGQLEGGGAPSGAPATGGGTGAGRGTAAAAAGLAIMLSGAGLVLVAARQRRRQRLDKLR